MFGVELSVDFRSKPKEVKKSEDPKKEEVE